MTEQCLKKTVDLVVITGDFTTKYRPLQSDLLIRKFKKITTQTITLAVLGNQNH
ncbi:hypothetical protein STA3757_44120 [Stanieria sp. NIES-3757]|nr:hypothetical protein STA3757_44120 [Stanieria sp. NIES-3757]